MKITDIQKILNKSNTKTDVSLHKEDEKFFDASFNKNDGIQVEKTVNTDEPPQDKKTYTKTTKDEDGNEITYTYNQKDNSPISKKTKYSYGYSQVETYLSGTSITSKIQEFNSKDKLLNEKTFYDSAPYGLKQEYEFDSETGGIKFEAFYKEDDSKSPELSKVYNDGKLISSKKKSRDVTEYTHYRNDGTIDTVTKEYFDSTAKYSESHFRKDGTLYAQYSSKQQIVYDRAGNVKEKRYVNDENKKVSQRYNEDGTLYIKETFSDSTGSALKERVVYNKNGAEYIKTIYGENGEIVDYTKNPRIGDKKYDKFSDRKLNGKLSTKFRQGKAGTCYVASAVQSFMLTRQGRDIINDSLEYDKENETSKVKFEGLDKEYSFSKDEIKKAMGRLGTGDPDFTVLVMGYEKYRSESKGRVVDGGFGNEVMFALCGKEGETNYIDGIGTISINNDILNDLQSKLSKRNAVITANTPFEDADTEFSKKDEKKGFVNSHAYSVSKITDKYIYVINPSDQKTIKMTREKFMESFESYCAVELM